MIDVNIKLSFSYLNILAINITGNRLFQLGETTSIICSTPVPVQSIQWIGDSNTIVRNGTSVQELPLNIMITPSSNNTKYTCIVSDGGGFVQSETIIIEVRGKDLSLQTLRSYNTIEQSEFVPLLFSGF